MNVISLPSDGHCDLRLEARGNDGQALASAGLWWTDVPAVPGETVGCIGAFEAADSASSCVLLDAALARLRAAVCTVAIGPMNGNTWRSHRFVVEDSGEPPFFLEPQNPPEYPAWFVAAGFRPLAQYSSSLLPLDRPAPDLARALRRLENRGLAIRPLRTERFRDELESIYQVCLASFAQNFLYTPISRDAFLASYAKVEPLVDPELVLLAERDGELLGFLFALPDPSMPGCRVILKTLAVHPRHRTGGLGSVLVAQVQQRACDKGFAAAIHALQHDSNSSRRITSRHDARVIRRYALFSRSLRP